MFTLDWQLVLILAFVYVIGTLFGYVVALKKGRRQGIEASLDSLIERGYIRTCVNARGETIIYKYWEKEKLNDQS
jgi:hypothetical protein